MLMFVVAIVQGIGNDVGADTDSFITYTCSGSKVIAINIEDSEVAHVKVFNHDHSYCIPDPQTHKGVLKCITEFNKKYIGTEKVHDVTLIYEDETDTKLVGGIHTKYYMLSCDEQSANVTVAMNAINFKTTTPLLPTKLGIPLTATPSLAVFKPDSSGYFIGQKITLEMTVDANYKLLPQSCTAYNSDTDDATSYMFWQRCTDTDIAIIPTATNKWTPVGSQSKLHIAMYAFRFVDSTTLVIKCSTTVCLTKELDSCKLECLKRKRRSNPGENKNVTTATVSVVLDVLDRQQFPENSSQGLSPIWYMYTIGFGMVYWMTWKKL